MISLKKRQSGFTIVELLIVIVIIGILATLVIVTFSGIQQRARDTQRKTDINALQSHVEAYYANQGNYPTRDNVNDDAWRSTNMKGLDPATLVDPKGTAKLGATASANQYAYVVTPAGCDNATTPCDGYSLTAKLEGDGSDYTKQSN